MGGGGPVDSKRPSRAGGDAGGVGVGPWGWPSKTKWERDVYSPLATAVSWSRYRAPQSQKRLPAAITPASR